MKICPCGCRQLVKRGNTYAQKGCGLRLRWAARPFNAKQIHRERNPDEQHLVAYGRNVREQKPKAQPESWWVGLSREALQAEALKRAPGTESA